MKVTESYRQDTAAVSIVSIVSPSVTEIEKLDAKIDEYEISLSDESEAFFTLFRLVK